MSPQPAEAIVVNDTIDNVLHELRRALPGPIFRMYRGALGPIHEFAVARCWLMPSPHGAAYLALSDAGLKVLAEDQIRRGLR